MYGIDVDLSEPTTSKVLRGRSWRWLLVRIHGLLNDNGTRLYAALTPDPPKTTGGPDVPEHR